MKNEPDREHRPEREDRIVIRWLRRFQSKAIAPTLARAYPPTDTPGFDETLKAIDEAEKTVWGKRDPAGPAAKPTE